MELWSISFAQSTSRYQVDSKEDTSKRYIIIHNDAPINIYPVVQIPEDGNCVPKSTRVNRIIFNRGLKTGETVKIKIPGKAQGHLRSCWYNAGRVYLFSVNIDAFEQKIQSAQRTTPHNFTPGPECMMLDNNKQPMGAAGGCTTGIANSSYPLDSPAQLAEYTFDADDPKTGHPSPDPDEGRLMTDIDLSYVDQVYLPIAIAIDNGGASGYMGTVMSYYEFNQRVNDFIRDAKWSGFAAYSPANWNNNVFHTLVPQSEHVPAGYNLFTLVNIQAISDLYTIPKSSTSKASVNSSTGPCAALHPENPTCAPGDTRECCTCTANDARCFCNRGCVVEGLIHGNLCCPTKDSDNKEVMLTCCSSGPTPPTPPTPPAERGFMIDHTYVGKKGEGLNPTVQQLVKERWQVWINPYLDPCLLPQFLQNPALNKKQFCKQFYATVQRVWREYKNARTKEPEKFKCSIDPSKPVDDTVCLIQHIIGYTYGPDGGWLPESVQAILRGVPWNDEKSGQPLYQYDKWLLFWAPYSSPYSLNPFTHFIHNEKDGINAVAYSFSIDDKYGNFRDQGDGFIINVGGDTAIENKSMFDPYQQYFVNWAHSWDHALVCGREISINALPGNSRISMWQNGKHQDFCEIIMYPTEANEPNLKFKISETKRTVKDNYTGQSHTVDSLTLDPHYCRTNSSHQLQQICDQVHLVPLDSGDTAYVSVDKHQRPNVSLNLPAAPTVTCDPECKGKLICVNGKCVPPSTTTVDIEVDPSKINPSDPNSLYCDGIVPNPTNTGATCNIKNNVLFLTQWQHCKNIQLSFNQEGILNHSNYHATSCGHYCVKLGACDEGSTPPPQDMVTFHYEEGTNFQCAPVGGLNPIVEGRSITKCPLDVNGYVTITRWGDCTHFMTRFENGNYKPDHNDPRASRIIPNPVVPYDVNIMKECQ